LFLFEKLLKLDNPVHIDRVINEHWEALMRKTEELRFSNESKIAYRDLKNILKYHIYKKRDGGIIIQIITEEGIIINDPKIVNEQLAKTIEEIQVDPRWKFLNREEFPRLPELNQEEVLSLMERLSTNKAITLDGLSDIMFEEDNIKRSSEIFRDLWSIALETLKGIQKSFTSRLIPLNKMFPEIPTRKQMRPILVCSPLQKLLEARFLPKLMRYLCEKLNTSQTGFIPGMGIQVNLFRAIQRIKKVTESGRNTYGLFIDFANAYNTVPHELLFQKLRKSGCMDSLEIDYLEALYTHYRIQIGNKIIKFNKGVAQGSILSPALFNIFIEDLAESLATELKMNTEDILLYADDILILCESQEQTAKCIQIIENWSQLNVMELNKKKSGIVVFASRKAKKIPLMELKRIKDANNKIIQRQWIPSSESIQGIPIMTSYKYLGTHLDFKLTLDTQYASITKKSDFVFGKLYPYLSCATADARKDMW